MVQTQISDILAQPTCSLALMSSLLMNVLGQRQLSAVMQTLLINPSILSL